MYNITINVAVNYGENLWWRHMWTELLVADHPSEQQHSTVHDGVPGMHNNMTQHDSIDYISCHIIVLQNRLESSIEPLLPVYQRVVLYGTSTIHEASGLGGLISLTATSIKYLAARPANHQDYWPLAPYCWRWIAARWKSSLLSCVQLVCWWDPVSWLGFPAWYNLRIGR